MASMARTYLRPLDLDPTFLTDDEFYSALSAQPDYIAMTRGRPSLAPLPDASLYVDLSLVVDPAHHVPPQDTDSPTKTGSERYSGSNSGGRSVSVSPHTASRVYTPQSASGLYDDLAADSREHRDEDETDPIIHASPSTGSYVLLHSMSSESGGDRCSVDYNQPPPSSWVTSSDPNSPSPSLIPSVAQQHQLWSSLASTSATGGWMEGHNGSQYGHTGVQMTQEFMSANYESAGYEPDLLASCDNMDSTFTQAFDGNLSRHRANYNQEASAFLLRLYQSAHAFNGVDAAYREHQDVLPVHQLRQAHDTIQQVSMRIPSNNHGYHHISPTHLPGSIGNMQNVPRPDDGIRSSPALHDSVPVPVPVQVPVLGILRRSSLTSLITRGQDHQHQINNDAGNVTPNNTSARPLQPAVPGQHTPSLSSQSDRAIARRGGRRKHTHLPDQTRVKSSKMRKTGACWGCALQRDPCSDEGTPCQRCIAKSQKGLIYYFPCERSKLPDLALDFLPPSMTLMHQKQSIEDCVTDQVLRWEEHNGIDIRLTCGYGPPLEWRVYEFVPRTMELLGQYQYRQDKQGMTRRLTKYSPPLGLMHIDASDSIRAESYLDRALEPDHLQDFGWTCFEEESQTNYFQATMLQSMCDLYLKTEDDDLQMLLQKIIRMMAITYIMGHTLTIEEDDFFTVMNSVHHSGVPSTQQPFTSPRLANRQLKFFFSILRGNIYDKILNWQQQTLHSSVKRESTWLLAFCVMLGFAMVLEEAQHTIILQADAKISKGEMTAEAANKEAENACQRIDERYTFLIRLFQSKYRDRKWTRGSFGNATPELKDPHARAFLRDLYNSVVEHLPHLQARREVQFKPEHQSIYTSRLVARFLLPFLGLPP